MTTISSVPLAPAVPPEAVPAHGHAPQTLVASAALLLGNESVVGFSSGQARGGVVNWSYVGLNLEGLLAIIGWVNTGRLPASPIRISGYHEIDPSSFAPALAQQLTQWGVADLAARANLVLRPPSADEIRQGKTQWKVGAAELSLAADVAPDGMLPFTSPSRNGNAWLANLKYEEGRGFFGETIAATAVMSPLPGHGQSMVSPGYGKGTARAGLHHLGYGFAVPLPTGKAWDWQAGAVTQLQSYASRDLSSGSGAPMSDVLGTAARLLEAQQVARAFDAALVHPVAGEPGMVLVGRNRVLLQTPAGGLQLEGNAMLALTPDGSNTLRVIGPDGQVLASVDYDRLQAALELLRQAAQAFTEHEPWLQMLGNGLAGHAAMGAAAGGWAAFKQLLGIGGRGNPSQAVAAFRAIMKAGDVTLIEVAQAVGGWKKLAAGMGGWPVLAKEAGGWGQLAKAAGGWMKLARELGGAGALARAMGGWQGVVGTALETVWVALAMEGLDKTFKAVELIGLDLKREGDAKRALELIRALLASPLLRLPHANAALSDQESTAGRNQAVAGLRAAEAQILLRFAHLSPVSASAAPQLVQPAHNPRPAPPPPAAPVSQPGLAEQQAWSQALVRREVQRLRQRYGAPGTAPSELRLDGRVQGYAGMVPRIVGASEAYEQALVQRLGQHLDRVPEAHKDVREWLDGLISWSGEHWRQLPTDVSAGLSAADVAEMNAALAASAAQLLRSQQGMRQLLEQYVQRQVRLAELQTHQQVMDGFGSEQRALPSRVRDRGTAQWLPPQQLVARQPLVQLQADAVLLRMVAQQGRALAALGQLLAIQGRAAIMAAAAQGSLSPGRYGEMKAQHDHMLRLLDQMAKRGERASRLAEALEGLIKLAMDNPVLQAQLPPLVNTPIFDDPETGDRLTLAQMRSKPASLVLQINEVWSQVLQRQGALRSGLKQRPDDR